MFVCKYTSLWSVLVVEVSPITVEVTLMCVHYRFIVRDFVYDPKAIKAEKDEKGKLEIDMKKEFVSSCS